MAQSAIAFGAEYLDKAIRQVCSEIEDGHQPNEYLWDSKVDPDEFQEGYTQLMQVLKDEGVEVIDTAQVVADNFSEFQGYVRDVKDGKRLQGYTKYKEQQYCSCLESILKSEDFQDCLLGATMPSPRRGGDVPIGANIVFQRDPNFTLKGENGTYVIPLNMNPVRGVEPLVSAFALEKSGATVVDAGLGVFKAEGGDFIYDENTKSLLIGTGPRTEQLAAIKVASVVEKLPVEVDNIAVIYRHYDGRFSDEKNMQAMHLDTYLSVAGRGAALWDEAENYKAVEWKNGGLQKQQGLRDYLEHLGYEVRLFPKKVQREMQFNIACYNNKVFACPGEVADWFRELGEEVVEVDMSSLNKAYGGLHCATKEIWKPYTK